MENRQACVWATRKELWDSFLNDPELTRALDDAHNASSSESEESDNSEISPRAESAPDGSPSGERIGARLRAYETPITDDILRQSIR